MKQMMNELTMKYAIMHLDFDSLEDYDHAFCWLLNGVKTFKILKERVQCIEKRKSSSGNGGHLRITWKCGDAKFDPEHFMFMRYFFGDCLGRIQADLKRKQVAKYFNQDIVIDTLFAYKDGKWAGKWKIIHGKRIYKGDCNTDVREKKNEKDKS